MNYTHEEIISALTVIKETCAAHACNGCPLARVSPCDGTWDCAISYASSMPERWNLKEDDQTWRAFK